MRQGQHPASVTKMKKNTERLQGILRLGWNIGIKTENIRVKTIKTIV